MMLGLPCPLTVSLLSPQWVSQELQQPQQRLQQKPQHSVSHHHPFRGREEGCSQMGRVGGTPGTVGGGRSAGPLSTSLSAQPHP